ncbi:MAG TPA: FISUMP domain-containing protein [Ignavibacteriaceae bacterium]|nr:FISUMP domain-containing protein [Ignavibacteriaceae bacterium]
MTRVDSMSLFICGASKINYAGQDYNTVFIGNQCWLKENLNVGTRIESYLGMSNNSIIEKYCYDNNPANCETYGGLYLWEEAMQYVNTEGTKGICPTGWHIPTFAEFQTLVDSVGNHANALKKIGQGTGEGQGTNSSGFSILLAGGRLYNSSGFVGLGQSTNLYSSKNGSCGYSCVYDFRIVAESNTIYLQQGTMPSWGLSVRCIRNVN